MIVGPRYKICKRLGSGIFEKCQTQKYQLAEARVKKGGSASKRPKAMSDYHRQLLEKQKARFIYGLSERQFSRYVKESMERTGDTFAEVLGRLERRLDNVVYRMGLAKTRRLARQMVSHGHIIVNGRKVTIPSHQVRTNDVISVREGSRKSVLFSEFGEKGGAGTPMWLRIDAATLSATVTGAPDRTNTELYFDLPSVLEFYSR